MRSADRKALLAYLRSTADALGLKDWTFEVSLDPCEDDCFASVNACEGRRVAMVCFCSDFRDRKSAEQREAVVHELLHCHHVSAADIIRLDLIKQLSQSTYDVLWSGFKRQLEYMVDALASVVAPHLPLIEWPEG